MKNILCVGYRDWALNIYEKITQNYSGGDVNIIASHDKYSDSLVIEFNPDLILFYGWSWMISKDIIDKYKCIMLHPSSLPKYLCKASSNVNAASSLIHGINAPPSFVSKGCSSAELWSLVSRAFFSDSK